MQFILDALEKTSLRNGLNGNQRLVNYLLVIQDQAHMSQITALLNRGNNKLLNFKYCIQFICLSPGNSDIKILAKP